jgi:hypothetical protein
MCLTMGLSGIPICGADVGGMSKISNIDYRLYWVCKPIIDLQVVSTWHFHAIFPCSWSRISQFQGALEPGRRVSHYQRIRSFKTLSSSLHVSLRIRHYSIICIVFNASEGLINSLKIYKI